MHTLNKELRRRFKLTQALVPRVNPNACSLKKGLRGTSFHCLILIFYPQWKMLTRGARTTNRTQWCVVHTPRTLFKRAHLMSRIRHAVRWVGFRNVSWCASALGGVTGVQRIPILRWCLSGLQIYASLDKWHLYGQCCKVRPFLMTLEHHLQTPEKGTLIPMEALNRAILSHLCLLQNTTESLVVWSCSRR